jgi:uncharacterized protein YndB with AHSA1/START domain
VIDASSVEIRRLLPHPAEEVFRWWTEPGLLERWMSPIGSVTAQVDLRVGGRFTIVMKDGPVKIEHRGEYLEIDPPRRLVFTWESVYTGGPTIVTVTLEPEGPSATRLLLVHSSLPEEVAKSHAGGWSAMVDRLDRMLEPR